MLGSTDLGRLGEGVGGMTDVVLIFFWGQSVGKDSL